MSPFQIECVTEAFGEREMFVIVPCRGAEVSAGLIEATDVCEGFQGEDIITYECPCCGAEHKSTVYAK